MAKAVAICTCERCGKTFERSNKLQNRSMADSWKEWAEEHFTVCSECWQAERQEAERQATEATNNLYGDITVGTPKQIAWAVKIRRQAAERLEPLVKRLKSEYQEAYKIWMAKELSNPDAVFWIDHRDDVDALAFGTPVNNYFIIRFKESIGIQ